MTYNKITQQLYIGSKDGEVIVLNVTNNNNISNALTPVENRIIKTENENQDFVLCLADDIVQYVSFSLNFCLDVE